MELSLKGRGVQITDQLRRSAERKLSRLARMEPRAVRLEVEVIAERNPRLDGARRIEGALHLPRRTFRAEAEAKDVDGALDVLAERLERQVRDHHERRRRRPGPRAVLRSAGPGGLEEAAEAEAAEAEAPTEGT
ncbi:MAG TPA: ribosome-associated translation inhibitor RaiA [Actinomycetota bacterium]|nr:ribosome-associated translation inhibitor RaiA [Actinomycetota bacterium]